MTEIAQIVDWLRRYVFEPGLDWVLDHPVISVVVVIGLIYWSVRGYRML